MIANSSVEPRFTTLASVSIAALIISFFCAPVCAEKEKSGGSFGVAPRAIVAQAPTESSRSAAISTLKYDDDRPEGKRSIAGTGLMIHFVKPAAQYQLKSLRIHCARYGMPVAPDEDVKFSIVSDDGATVLHTELIPYSKFKRGEPEWTTIGFKNAVDIPEQFWVVAEFNAERTKGVYVSYDTSTGGKHSKTGLPGQESRNVTTGGDWMIQAILLASKP